MTDKLYREFALGNPQRWEAVKSFVECNYKPFAASGHPLRIIISSREEKRRAAQNRLYWKVVIGNIADQAWIGGKQFSAEAWHEMMAREHGVCVELTLPSGEMIIKRLSTSEMKVSEFTQYIEEVMAWASNELGIRFPAIRE